jgi:hypothetical protein
MSEQPQESEQIVGSIHIEHYFPKGYNPEGEPWKFITAHHYAALAAERDKVKQLEADYQKIVTEVLKCDPIPASQRSDDQLEPPWEVIARIRHQLAAELEITNQRVAEQVRASYEISKQLREQLDAEQSSQQAEKQNLVRKYSEALAAEREQVKTLANWLGETRRELLLHGDNFRVTIGAIEAALAKVKEGSA